MPQNKNTIYRKNRPRVTPRRKWLLIGAAAAILGIVALLAFKPFASNPKADTQTSHPTANSETKGEPQQPNDPAQNPATDQNQTPADSGSQKPIQEGPSGQTELLTPSGNFVSNHHPSLDNSPTIQSVCVTTPGATCHITFTKGSIVKTLSTETADRGGAVYWTWKLQDVGITEGSWTITAEATWGSQTKSANDTLYLEVSP